MRIALRSSKKLTPPASGVPVPGNTDVHTIQINRKIHRNLFLFQLSDCFFQSFKSKRMKICVSGSKLKFFSLSTSDTELMDMAVSHNFMDIFEEHRRDFNFAPRLIISQICMSIKMNNMKIRIFCSCGTHCSQCYQMFSSQKQWEFFLLSKFLLLSFECLKVLFH